MKRSGVRLALGSMLVAAIVALTAHAGEVLIGQKNKAFSQKKITIKKGDTLVFVNDDTIAHNVFSRSDGFKFNLKIQKPGERTSVPMPTSGRAVVRCAIHPQMELEVIVEE
jgi:plastocyanin